MTQPILVQVKTRYIEEQSEPQEPRFVYGYTITLLNQGEEPARLVSRHWIITDAEGAVQEVQGMGVVGEQPRLDPGESYTYTSGVVLQTETGTMTGSYQMLTDDGVRFDAQIPEFALVPPHALH
jgi:ApaG protein